MGAASRSPSASSYVVIFLDVWSRRIVGRAISRSIDVRLALAVLKAAIGSRRSPEGVTSCFVARPYWLC
jgi:putative transposase